MMSSDCRLFPATLGFPPAIGDVGDLAGNEEVVRLTADPAGFEHLPQHRALLDVSGSMWTRMQVESYAPLLTGRRQPSLCPTCDADRVGGHVARFVAVKTAASRTRVPPQASP